MTKIKSVIFYFVFLPSAIVLAIIALLSYTFSRFRPYWVLKLYGKTTRFLLRVFGNVKIEVLGNPHQISDQPVLIIANHVSALDTIALAPILSKNNFTYVVKKSLMEWKSFPFNLGCRTAWCIPVSREANAGDFSMMIDECKKRFDKNISVLIFPKGTRESDLIVSTEIPPTGLLIAKKLKCPVLPVFFDTINWRNGKIIKDAGLIISGTAKIHIGQLIPADQATNIKPTHAVIQQFFQDCIKLSSNIKPLAEQKLSESTQST